MAETQSLAPAWLSFNKELPASSQEKVIKPQADREKLPKRFGKQNSYQHPPSHPSSLSSNWRNSDLNPRILNRSKSSPVFDGVIKQDNHPEPPKSPDRANNIPPQSVERNLSLRLSPKLKMKARPPLLSSRSQPNLLTKENMAGWQHQKITATRSPPSSRSSSFSSSGPSPLTIPVQPAPVSQAASATTDDVKSDTEIEKLRALVPAAAVAPLPKPPSRLATTRKNAHTKPQEKPKKPSLPLPSLLKKASSEPLLFAPGSPEDLARRAKLAYKKEAVKLKEIVEAKDKTITTRNNFFLDVFKLEKQQTQDLSEEELEIPTVVVNDGASTVPIVDGDRLEAAYYDADRLSPINKDDEERFLRLLGWVPDEEDHVPELDEKEIAEVKLKLRQGSSTPNSPLRNSYPISAREAAGLVDVGAADKPLHVM